MYIVPIQDNMANGRCREMKNPFMGAYTCCITKTVEFVYNN